MWSHSGADPGFLETGFICIKVLGFALLFSLSHFLKWNYLVSLRTNYFISIGYLKTVMGDVEGSGGFKRTP